MESPRIAVITRDWGRDQRLFEAVASLYDVSFWPARDLGSSSCNAVVMMRASLQEALEAANSGMRCLAFVTGDAGPSAASSSSPVEFSSSKYLAGAFRNASLLDDSLEVLCGQTLPPGDEVVAHRGADVLWARHLRGKAAVDVVGVAPPVLAKAEYLCSRFSKNNWFSLLPLLQFVKDICGWTVPPLRACFMVDDPNLHWPSYGYVKYDEIANDSALHNYHVAFATVPMDGWFVHASTSQLFRDFEPRMSLLVHGNNHTHRELARTSTRDKQTAVAAQAFRRAAAIEKASGVQVARIMAAPHGACNEAMAQALLRTGFQAACISLGSLMAHNPNLTWPLTVGMTPAELLGGGLPVIPRFPIQSNAHNYARLAAFLGQPVVLVGHHDDLADGLGVFHKQAAVINAIDTVKWENIDAISRSNCWLRRQGELLQVRMYSRSLQLQLPPGVNTIVVERPWLLQNDVEPLVVEGESVRDQPIVLNGGRRVSLLSNGPCVRIRSVPRYSIDPYTVPSPSIKPSAIVRRHVCEIRDRLRPTFDTMLGSATPYKRA